jgi:hypothetical protein
MSNKTRKYRNSISHVREGDQSKINKTAKKSIKFFNTFVNFFLKVE